MLIVVLFSYFTLTSVFQDVNAQDYRLPKTVFPVNYSLQIIFDTLDINTTRFLGVTEITIRPAEDTSQIKLNAQELTISLVELFDETNQALDIILDEINTETQILTLNTSEILRKDATYLLRFNYTGKLETEGPDGVYRNIYIDSNGAGEDVTSCAVSTMFEWTFARKAFPSFDEPAFKARFTLTITAPDEYVSQANTPAVSTTSSGGYTTVVFQPSPIMSSYLVAFTISKYTYDEAKIGTVPVPFRIWTRPEVASNRNLSLTNAPLIMAELEKTFSPSYESSNIGKMDFFAFVNYDGGGMENWGHVTFTESTLLYNDSTGDILVQAYVLREVTHELTHTWFGNMVTVDWWSDLFVQEGLADYYEAFLTNKVYPEFELDKEFVTGELHLTLEYDSSGTTNALTYNVSTPSEIATRFDSISYTKGASVFRMVVTLIGNEAFERGLQKFINKYQYQNVGWQNLYTIWNDEYTPSDNITLLTALTNWTIYPGYPYINVTSSGNNVTLQQKNFVLTGQTSDTEWYVPISFRTSGNANFSITNYTNWLIPGEVLNLPNVLANQSWIIFNTQQTGFYRVLYDANLLAKIQDVLEKNPEVIHVSNRAQVADDLENFAKANITSYATYFNFIRYLKKETEYYPWYAVLSGISDMLNSLSNEALRQQLRTYVAGLLSNFYKSVPIDMIKPHDYIYTMKQVLALNWACKLGYQDCIDNTQHLFQNYRNKGQKPNANIRSTVYCSVLRRSSNVSDFYFLWNEFIASNDAGERKAILKSLGCSEDQTVLKTYLNLIFASESKVYVQDLSTAVNSLFAENNEVGLNVLLDYLVDHFSTVYNRYGTPKRVRSLIEGLSKRFNTKQQYDQFQILINRAEIATHVKTVLAHVIEKSNYRLQVVDNLEAQLADYFKVQ